MTKHINSADAHELVCILNERYFELSGDTEVIPFDFSSNGYSEAITFFEYPIWTSECDGYADDGESLATKVFILLAQHMKKVDIVDAENLFYHKQWD